MSKTRIFLVCGVILIGGSAVGGGAYLRSRTLSHQDRQVTLQLPDPPSYQESLPNPPAGTDSTEVATESDRGQTDSSPLSN